jgi:hypothetical protein
MLRAVSCQIPHHNGTSDCDSWCDEDVGGSILPWEFSLQEQLIETAKEVD